MLRPPPVSDPATRDTVEPAGTGAPTAARGVRATLVFGVLGLTAVVSVVLAVSLGPITVPFGDTVSILAAKLGLPTGTVPERYALVVDDIRLPRVLTGGLAGAGLATAGAVLQALYRNPLADPGITGASSGAAVGAVLVLATGATAVGWWVLPGAAFAGALVAVCALQAVVLLRRDHSASTLILTGIALNAFFGAVVSAVVANAPHADSVLGITFWLQGDLNAADWTGVRLLFLPVLLGVAAACVFARDLNVLLLGDAQARSSGLDTVRVRRALLVLASLLTAVCVCVTGVIGFVGLVVPHAVRLVLGPDHRLLLPASALAGGAFLVLADLGARMLFSPVVLQTGVVTAFLGAPGFLWLVLRGKRDA